MTLVRMAASVWRQMLPEILWDLDVPGPDGGLCVEAGGDLQLQNRPRLPVLLLHLTEEFKGNTIRVRIRIRIRINFSSWIRIRIQEGKIEK